MHVVMKPGYFLLGWFCLSGNLRINTSAIQSPSHGLWGSYRVHPSPKLSLTPALIDGSFPKIGNATQDFVDTTLENLFSYALEIGFKLYVFASNLLVPMASTTQITKLWVWSSIQEMGPVQLQDMLQPVLLWTTMIHRPADELIIVTQVPLHMQAPTLQHNGLMLRHLTHGRIFSTNGAGVQTRVLCLCLKLLGRQTCPRML